VRAAFAAANSVSIKEVVESGLQGMAIREELSKRRVAAIAEWREHQEILAR
jgi:tRNA nucleotidyltransferase (CCA-adding enzyme)